MAFFLTHVCASLGKAHAKFGVIQTHSRPVGGCGSTEAAVIRRLATALSRLGFTYARKRYAAAGFSSRYPAAGRGSWMRTRVPPPTVEASQKRPPNCFVVRNAFVSPNPPPIVRTS